MSPARGGAQRGLWLCVGALLLAGCSRGAPADAQPAASRLVVEPGEGDLTGLHTAFRGAPAWRPTAEQAFAARERCPRLTEVAAEVGAPGVLRVAVRGEGLDAVRRVGARLSDGSLAEAIPKPGAGGALEFPIACVSCDVFLAIEADNGNSVACTGPGYSVHIDNQGRIVHPRALKRE